MAKKWKQLMSISRSIAKQNMVYIYVCIYKIHTTEYYSALKRNQILVYATSWMNLKNIPSKISQTQRTTIVQFHLSDTHRDFPGGTWKRIRLPMQETRVQFLDQEESTCREATRPMHPNYRICALQPVVCKRRCH